MSGLWLHAAGLTAVVGNGDLSFAPLAGLGLDRGKFYSVASALLWAVAIVLFRASGDHVTPVALNLFKNCVGFTLMVLTMALIGVDFAPAGSSVSDWLILLASGAIGIALADSLFFASLNRLGASGSAIVDCLYSPLVIACAWLYLGEPVGPALVAAMVLVGVAIVIGTWEPQSRLSGEARRQRIEGVGLGIAAMAFMAAGIVIAKPVLETADAWWAAALRLGGAVPVLVGVGMLPSQRRGVAACFRPGRHWWVMLPGSVMGGYCAMIVWILGFKYTQAGIASVLNQTSIFFVLVLATVFLKERLTVRRVLAVAIGFAGAVLVSF